MKHSEHSQLPPQIKREETERNRQDISADLENVLREFFYPKEEFGISSNEDTEDAQALFDIYCELLHDKNYFEQVQRIVELPNGETEQDLEESLYELIVEMIIGYKELLGDIERKTEETHIASALPMIRKRLDHLQKIARELEKDPRFRQSAEKVERRQYEKHLLHLGITEKELKNANRVLDLGAGNRLFASHCLRKKIHPEVYSVEPIIEDAQSEGYRRALWTPDIQKQIDERTVQGKSERLPFKNETFDLILMHHFVPKITSFHLLSQDGKHRARRREAVQAMKMSYDELLRVLRPDGEVRLYPFTTPPPKQNNDAMLRYLRALERSGRCKITIEPLREEETGGYDGWARIIIRKMKQ